MWMPFLNRQAQGLVRKSRLSERHPASSKIPAERKAEGGCRRDTQTRSGSSRGSERSARAREGRGLSRQGWGQRGLGRWRPAPHGGSQGDHWCGHTFLLPTEAGRLNLYMKWPRRWVTERKLPALTCSRSSRRKAQPGSGREACRVTSGHPRARALMSCPDASVQEVAPQNTCAGDEDACGDAACHTAASF